MPLAPGKYQILSEGEEKPQTFSVIKTDPLQFSYDLVFKDDDGKSVHAPLLVKNIGGNNFLLQFYADQKYNLYSVTFLNNEIDVNFPDEKLFEEGLERAGFALASFKLFGDNQKASGIVEQSKSTSRDYVVKSLGGYSFYAKPQSILNFALTMHQYRDNTKKGQTVIRPVRD